MMVDKQKLLTWLEKQSKNNALSQAFYAFEEVIKGIKAGAFDATDCLSKEAVQEIINTADVIDAKNQDLLEEIEEFEFANNEWKTVDKLWKETVEQLVISRDDAYKQIENLKKVKKMSSYRHAQYAGELREEIISLGEEIKSQNITIEQLVISRDSGWAQRAEWIKLAEQETALRSEAVKQADNYERALKYLRKQMELGYKNGYESETVFWTRCIWEIEEVLGKVDKNE